MKSGWKTTEFWLTIFTIANSIISQYAEFISSPWGLVAASVIGSAYTISRGLAKKGN